MTSLVISFACFTEILNQISSEQIQIFTNGKRCFYSFKEAFVIHLEYEGVKI